MVEEKKVTEETVEVKTTRPSRHYPRAMIPPWERRWAMREERKAMKHSAGRAMVYGIDAASRVSRGSMKLAKDVTMALAPIALRLRDDFVDAMGKSAKRLRRLGENWEAS